MKEIYQTKINIDTALWGEILDDVSITTQKIHDILDLMLECEGSQATAGELAQQLNYGHPVSLNSEVAYFAKRILRAFPHIQPPLRANGEIRYWYIPFWGQYRGKHFLWILRPELVEALLLKHPREQHEHPHTEEFEVVAEESPDFEQVYTEGHYTKVLINKYERNKHARSACLEHFGYVCMVCGFDFEKVYGAFGKGKIHVHHRKPISQCGKGYVVNPIKDLQPVCPNCHLMIHSRRTPYTVAEIQKMILQQRNSP
jgi:5-methylcytosine-specific restriction enzyme A